MYGLEDPSSCLERDPPKKSYYKEYIQTKITAYHEKIQKENAKNSKCLRYFNVSLLGLRGRAHPAIQNVFTPEEVKKMRPHIKFLTGNYLTMKIRSEQSDTISPHCTLCDLGCDQDYCHLLASCDAFQTERNKLLTQLSLLCEKTKNNILLSEFTYEKETLTQFILDPCSLNLTKRVSMDDPLLPEFFRLSRNFCFVIEKRCTQRYLSIHGKRR